MAMAAAQRQQEILDYLKVKKAASVQVLCAKLYASPATVRRDLAQLERRGLVQRTHGGAVLCEGGSDEMSLFARQGVNARQKNAIARLAACYVRDSDSLFMDSSSTVACVAPHLGHYQRLSVVTNGLHCALALAQNVPCDIFFPAGRLAARTNSVTGSDTVEEIGRYCADVAFVSCGGLSIEAGATEPSVEQSRVKLQMLRQARTRILLCDTSKFGRTFFSRTAPLSLFDRLITDAPPGAQWVRALEEAGCELVVAREE